VGAHNWVAHGLREAKYEEMAGSWAKIGFIQQAAGPTFFRIHLSQAIA